MTALTQTVAHAERGALSAERVVQGLLIAGVALRLWQWGAGAALHVGELALARNIVERDVGTLMRTPMVMGQVAAPAYVLFIKLLSALVGTSDRVLRLAPLLSSFVVLWLTRRLARTYLGEWGQVTAVGLVALGVPYIQFAAIIKPYGAVDPAAALVIAVVVSSLFDSALTTKAIVSSVLVGALVFTFSQSAPLMAAGAGLALLLHAARARDWNRSVRAGAILAGWIVAAVLVARIPTLVMGNSARAGYGELYAADFLPRFPHVGEQMRAVVREFVSAFSDKLFHYGLPAVMLSVTAVALAATAVTKRRLFALALLPLVVTIVASALQQYVFSWQYLLFLCPFLFLCIGALVDVGATWLTWPPLVWSWRLAWLAPATFALVKAPPPYYYHELPRVLAHVQAQWQQGDAMYVFFAARNSMRFYGPRYGFTPDRYQQGRCHRGDPHGYLTELDAMRGRSRVWVLVMHDAGRDHARAEILHYLDGIGAQKDSIVIVGPPLPPATVGAYGYLYDLSDTVKLANPDGTHAAMLSSATPHADLTCGWGPSGEEDP